MSKPLPEHVTRAEAAAVLRLSLRQVDRLAETGVLKKRKLSASRSGFARQDLDAYLGGLGDGYVSPVGSFSFSLPPESSLTCNAVTEKLDEILATRLPGCLVRAEAKTSKSCGTRRWATRRNRSRNH
jgi:hypothetical protein